MKRLAPLMIIALVSCFKPASSSDKNGNDGLQIMKPITFRNASWGMTKDEIRSIEKERLRESDIGSLESWDKSNLSGSKCNFSYTFLKDKFFLGNYVCFIDERIAQNAYTKIRSDLEKQYGTLPNPNANRWVNGRYSITLRAKKTDYDQTMITVDFMEE